MAVTQTHLGVGTITGASTTFAMPSCSVGDLVVLDIAAISGYAPYTHVPANVSSFSAWTNLANTANYKHYYCVCTTAYAGGNISFTSAGSPTSQVAVSSYTGTTGTLTTLGNVSLTPTIPTNSVSGVIPTGAMPIVTVDGGVGTSPSVSCTNTNAFYNVQSTGDTPAFANLAGSGATIGTGSSQTFTGTGGGTSNSYTLAVYYINATAVVDFTLTSASNPLNVYANNSATDLITVGGGGTTVNLTASDSDVNISYGLGTASGTPVFTSLLTVSAVANPTDWTSTLTVSGTNGTNTHNLPITVNILDFNLTYPSSVTTSPSNPGLTINLTVNPINGFADSVALSASATTGIHVSLTNSTGVPSFVASLTITATASGQITITGVDAAHNITHTYIITVIYSAGGGGGGHQPVNNNAQMVLSPAIVYNPSIGQNIPTKAIVTGGASYPVTVNTLATVSTTGTSWANSTATLTFTVLTVPSGTITDVIASSGNTVPIVSGQQLVNKAPIIPVAGSNFNALLAFAAIGLPAGNTGYNVLYIDANASASGNVTIAVGSNPNIVIAGLPGTEPLTPSARIAIPFSIQNLTLTSGFVIINITVTQGAISIVLPLKIFYQSTTTGGGGGTPTGSNPATGSAAAGTDNIKRNWLKK